MPQGKRLTIDEFLKRPAAPQPKSVSIDEFLTRPVLPPQPQESYYQQLKRNLGMGFEQLGQKVSDVAAAGYEIGSGLLRGDTRPLKETAELAARGAAPIAAAFSNPYFAPQAYLNTAAEQRQPIAEVERQRAQRREDAGGVYFRGSAIENAKLAERAAQDPSLLARIERSLPQLLPYIGAAAASGGSAPVLAATGAVMELNEPQNIPISAALSSLPIPSAKTILRPILSRIRGAVSAAERIESAAAKATMEGTGPAAVQGASTTVTQPVDALQSAFAKLGTENADDISAMIFNANRRFNSPKSITPEERAAAIEDFNKVVKLTPDEEHALAQVLPEYSYNPVNAGYTGAGRYERQISDIPNAEPNAQLDANLRQLEQFFGSEGRATAPGIAAETGPPVISEAPAMSVGASAARGPSASVSGPSVSAPMDLSVAIAEAAETVPASLGNRIKDELAAIYHLPKTLKSSIDISAPFRQGSLLTIPPSQWGRAARAGVRMFQAFSTKKYNQIVDAIANHVDAPIADEAGLYLATKGGTGLQKAEEAFMSKYAGRIPLVKQSEQAYKTYLDSLRMDTFSKYKRVIDSSGLTPEQAQNAYKAAATWINYATGRGSAGQTIDRAMPALNGLLFSPRYLASRLNVLNPVYYARNAATAEGRVVLKQQMGELLQYAGLVAGTLKLAQAAGADVSLKPDSPDFLKIRAGNWRYDPLAGLQQIMRLTYRLSDDIRRRQGKAGDIATSFLRSKLAPAPAVFVDFVKGRTMAGKPFSGGKAVADLVAPIQWVDFVEAYQQEGFGGVAKASPGLVGVGVQNYEPKPVKRKRGRQ